MRGETWMSEPQTLNLASQFTIFYDIMIDDRTGRNITSPYGASNTW